MIVLHGRAVILTIPEVSTLQIKTLSNNKAPRATVRDKNVKCTENDVNKGKLTRKLYLAHQSAKK